MEGKCDFPLDIHFIYIFPLLSQYSKHRNKLQQCDHFLPVDFIFLLPGYFRTILLVKYSGYQEGILDYIVANQLFCNGNGNKSYHFLRTYCLFLPSIVLGLQYLILKNNHTKQVFLLILCSEEKAVGQVIQSQFLINANDRIKSRPTKYYPLYPCFFRCRKLSEKLHLTNKLHLDY